MLKNIKGIVISDKADKTLTVKVEEDSLIHFQKNC